MNITNIFLKCSPKKKYRFTADNNGIEIVVSFTIERAKSPFRIRYSSNQRWHVVVEGKRSISNVKHGSSSYRHQGEVESLKYRDEFTLPALWTSLSFSFLRVSDVLIPQSEKQNFSIFMEDVGKKVKKELS